MVLCDAALVPVEVRLALAPRFPTTLSPSDVYMTRKLQMADKFVLDYLMDPVVPTEDDDVLFEAASSDEGKRAKPAKQAKQAKKTKLIVEDDSSDEIMEGDVVPRV